MDLSFSDITLRYTEVLFQQAEKQQIIELLQDQLSLWTEFLDKNPRLYHYMIHPIQPRREREKRIRKMLKGWATPLLGDFISLLFRKGRISYLAEITNAFSSLEKKRRGIVSAQLYAATALSKEEEEQLLSFAHRLIPEAHKICLNITIQPTLLAGYILEIQDKRMDRSLAGQLKRLAQRWHCSNYIFSSHQTA